MLCQLFQLAGQQQPLFTQYMNNPLIINSAFTGNRNALSIDLITRQQWMGLKGAPSTYYMNIHSPINDTKTSVGGYIFSDIAGPITYNSMVFTYSYLMRTSDNSFLSFGLNGGVDNHWIGLNKLDVNDPGDPHFSENIENVFKPVFGSGLVFFTPTFFVGFSVPQLIPSRINHPNIENSTLDFGYNMYFSSGAKLLSTNGFMMKAATLARLSKYYNNNYDFSLQFFYKSHISFATSYRLKNAMAFILGTQINEYLEISYSYDFPLKNNKIHNISNQELALSLSISKFYIRNRDREFIKRAKAEDDALRSIRHF